MRARRLLACAALASTLACAGAEPAIRHTRYDYWAFRARVGLLPEPNYLPWAMHLETLPDGGPGLVACRWPDDAFPLRYHVGRPLIPIEEQDEFKPRDPAEYVEAVHRAFRLWEKAIGRPVRFEAVDDPADAVLVVRLRAELFSSEDRSVLGVVRSSAESCRVLGAGDTPEQVGVAFQVTEAELFVVDEHGLLTPHQVLTVALHEIGHILGASGQHSPLRGDVMYPIADDGRIEELSEHDGNTFRALYKLPPGAVYARLDTSHAEPLSEVRRGPPRLEGRHRDDSFDFEVSFPKGWQVIRSQRGFVAVDGVSWDYDASIQLIALRGRREDFVDQRRRSLRYRGELAGSEGLELDGQPLTRLVAKGDGWAEETVVQDWDEGWLLVMVADCNERDYSLYRPWFERVLLSIDRATPAPQRATPAPQDGAP